MKNLALQLSVRLDFISDPLHELIRNAGRQLIGTQLRLSLKPYFDNMLKTLPCRRQLALIVSVTVIC
ncbi:MAG: hypothetical protein ACTS73_03035 [Arsenophonus sp. NEOnobi-MAG3]